MNKIDIIEVYGHTLFDLDELHKKNNNKLVNSYSGFVKLISDLKPKNVVDTFKDINMK